MSAQPSNVVKLAPELSLADRSSEIVQSDAFTELVIQSSDSTDIKKAALQALKQKFTTNVTKGQDAAKVELDFADFAEDEGELLDGENDEQSSDKYTASDLFYELTTATDDYDDFAGRAYLFDQGHSEKRSKTSIWANADEIDQYFVPNVSDQVYNKAMGLYTMLSQTLDGSQVPVPNATPSSSTQTSQQESISFINDDNFKNLLQSALPKVGAIGLGQIDTNDGDDDMPGLEDDSVRDVVADDDDDDDMPSLDDICVASTGDADKKTQADERLTDWFHTVAIGDASEKTKIQQLTDQRVQEREAALRGEVVESATEQTEEFTSAANNAQSVWDHKSCALAFDFRLNKVPNGCKIINHAQFTRESDGATSLSLDPGSYLHLEPKFPKFGRFAPPKYEKYLVCFEVFFETLPTTTITLCTTDIGKSGFAEIVMTREGLVGVNGGEMSSGRRIQPGRWERLAISINCSQNRYDFALMILLNNRVIVQSYDRENTINEKGAIRDRIYIFGSHKPSQMDRTVRVRSIYLQPRTLSQYDLTLPDGQSTFSTWQHQLAEDKCKMFREMSLASLYNRPPPAWKHPLLSSTLLSSNVMESLDEASVEYQNLFLWSNLLTQTSETQHHLYPEPTCFPPQTISQLSIPVDNKESQTTAVTTALNDSISRAFLQISSAFLDASMIIKAHPFNTQLPNGAQYVKRLVQRIESLALGEFTIVPFLVRQKVLPADPVNQKVSVDQFPVLLVIQQQAAGMASVSLINTALDKGVKFHGVSAASNASPFAYKPVVTIDDVPMSRFTEQGAWYAMQEAIFSSNTCGFLPVDDFYFKILPNLLGLSWEEVIYNAQQREVEFTKLTLQQAAEVERGVEDANKTAIDYKRFADCEYYDAFGVGTTTELIIQTTVFLFKRIFGCSELIAQKLFLCIKCRILDMYLNDLSHINVINPSDKLSIEKSIQDVSYCVTKVIERAKERQIVVKQGENVVANVDKKVTHSIHEQYSTQQLYIMYRGLTRLQRELTTVKITSFSHEEQQSLLLDDGGRSKQSQHTLFPFAEQFVLSKDQETIIDASVQGALSFDLLDLPQGIRSYGDLIYVLRKAKDLCVSLRVQRRVIVNSPLLARTFLSHVLTNIVPVPVSNYAPEIEKAQSFYFQPATYAELNQIVEICSSFLRILLVLSWTETMSCISKSDKTASESGGFGFGGFYGGYGGEEEKKDKPKSHFFGELDPMSVPLETQLIGGVIFSILDFALHKPPSDQRSVVVDVILQGNYGLDLGQYIPATACLQLINPAHAIVRSKVIEYFALSQKHYTKYLLTLDNDVVGSDTNAFFSTLYLFAGYTPAILRTAETGSASFSVNESILYFKNPELRNVVSSIIQFRGLVLDPSAWSSNVHRIISEQQHPSNEGVTESFYNLNLQVDANADILSVYSSLGRFPSQVRSNRPDHHSLASAHTIINQHLYQQHINGPSKDVPYEITPITNEDDILHIKSLPDFNATLSPQDSEQLLSYLTTPYLRIPLILSFFAAEDRSHALRCGELRDLLSAVLFEQGQLIPFHHKHSKDSLLPANVPTEDPTLLGTNYGYLFNELVHNPQILTTSLITMFKSLLELDIGTFHSAATPILLYMIRIICGIEGYMVWLLEYNEGKVQTYTNSTAFLDGVTSTTISPESAHNSSMMKQYIALPGLTLTKEQYERLQEQRNILGEFTQGLMMNKLLRWSSQLFCQVHMSLEQKVYAHQKAEKFITQQQAALTAAQLEDGGVKPADDKADSDEEDLKAGSSQPSWARQPRRGRGRQRHTPFGGGFNFGGGNDDGDTADRALDLPAIKSNKYKTNKFSLFSPDVQNKMMSLGLGKAFKNSPGESAQLRELGKEAQKQAWYGASDEYVHEDNRTRRITTIKRKVATVHSLDHTPAVAETKKEGESDMVKSLRTQITSLEESSKSYTAAGMSIPGYIQEQLSRAKFELQQATGEAQKDTGDTSNGMVLDGGELTDNLQLSCLVHAHILLARGNHQRNLSPSVACDIVCSMMYLTSHFSWLYRSVIRHERIYEVSHKFRRSLISIADRLPQEALNQFMDKIIKVATCLNPLDPTIVVQFLLAELGSTKSSQELPTSHPMYQTVKNLQTFHEEWTHALSLVSTPPPLTESSAPTRAVRQFGYVPGARGRYVALATPITLSQQEYAEYYSTDPGDLYEKNLDCEVNLQSFSISVKNASMEAIPMAYQYSEPWQVVFGGPLQGALIEKNNKFEHYRVIGTGVDAYKYSNIPITPELTHSRIYSPNDLHRSEQWVIPILEPFRLAYLDDPWNPVVILFPEHSHSVPTAVITAQVCAQRNLNPLCELHIYRDRKCINAYGYASYNLRIYKYLICATHRSFTFQSQYQSSEPRKAMWSLNDRHSSQFALPSSVSQSPVVLTRDTSEVENLSGGLETYIPVHLLAGIIPEGLTNLYVFWQDTLGNIRGYPSKKFAAVTALPTTQNALESILFLELITVSKLEITLNRGTCFNVTKVPIHVMKQRLEQSVLQQSGLSATKSQSSSSAETTTTTTTTTYSADEVVLIPHKLAESKLSAKSSLSLPTLLPTASLQAKASSTSVVQLNPDGGIKDTTANPDEVYELINLLHAPKGASTYQLATVLTRMDALSQILPWKTYTGKQSLELAGSHIVSHYVDEIVPVSSENNANIKFAREADDDDVHGLLLQDENNLDLDVFEQRKAIVDKVLMFDLVELITVQLRFKSQFNTHNELQLFSLDHSELYISNERSPQLAKLMKGLPHSVLFQTAHNELNLIVPAWHLIRPLIQSDPYSTELVINYASVGDVSYFKYPIHTSHSFMFLPTLTSALYLLVARFLNRDYAASIKLLEPISTDVPLNATDSIIFNLLAQGRYDAFDPNALSVMIRISLATLQASNRQPWNLYSYLTYYSAFNIQTFASSATRLTHSEEFSLLEQLLTTDVTTTAKKLLSKSTMHHGLHIARLYNRFTYLSSILNNFPSYPVLLPPRAQFFKTCHTSTLPSADHFVAWYISALRAMPTIKDIPAYTISEPKITANGAVARKTAEGGLTLGNFATAEEELQATIPLHIQTALPKQSKFKCDITKEEQQFTFITTLSAISAQTLIIKFAGKEVLHSKRGFGFIICYMLLTGDTVFKLNGKDASYSLGCYLARSMNDFSHKHPLNFILALLVEKPELGAILPKLSQYKPLSTLRNIHKEAAALDLGPFIMFIARVIVRLFVIDPELVSSARSTNMSAKQLQAPALTIPVYQNSHSHYYREPVLPVVTDTDCNVRFSVDYHVFLQNSQLTTQLSTLFTALLEQENTEYKNLLALSLTQCPTGRTTHSQLQHQPLDTMILTQFIDEVTRADKSLPPLSEYLPFDISQHPAAQTSIAKAMANRLTEDISVYARGVNNSKEILFKTLSHSDQIKSLLLNPQGAEMKQSIALLHKLVDTLELLRSSDTRFISLGQDLITQITNSVGLPTQYQSVLKKLYTISNTSFTGNDLADGSDFAEFTEETRDVITRIHYLLSRESGQETNITFDYIVGTMISSRAAFDLLKLNPYIPQDSVALIYSLAESVLLRTNRISHINRTLQEISDVLAVLNKSRFQSLAQVNLVVDDVAVTSILQKSSSLVKSLSAKRFYFNKVDADELTQVVSTLKQDEAVQKVWESYDKERKQSSGKASSKSSKQGPQSILVCEQLSVLINQAITARDIQILHAHQREQLKQSAQGTSSTMVLKKITKITKSNKRHLARHTLLDPLSSLGVHPLKAYCPLNDRAKFVLRLISRRAQSEIGQQWERQKAAQLDADSSIEPKSIWDILHMTPHRPHSVLKDAKRGRFGLSNFGRAGMRSQVLETCLADPSQVKKYDPRYLVFEFTWSLLLRKTQVEMVNDFVDQVQSGRSVCRQLLMGQGKTTVILPLLSLMLSTSAETSDNTKLTSIAQVNSADKTQGPVIDDAGSIGRNPLAISEKLVISVVPPALLEFSRSIMRSTFSSVIFKKVVTFSFERATIPTTAMLTKLKRAAQNRHIVVSTPTSVKSVMLKFLELQHSIAHPELGRDSNAEQQLSVLTQILQLFKQSVLLMDEVDLVLNPLKSELNFPFGEKSPLEFTPLRWNFCSHVLDAVLFYELRYTPALYQHNKRAHLILQQLVNCFDYGFKHNFLQASPHPVLLNQDFYHDKIKPIIIDWVILYLDSQHISNNLTHQHIKLFFNSTTIELSDVTNPEIVELVTIMNDIAPHSLKLLNLARDWVQLYLPHVLSKISRVNYGLLSPQDLVQALSHDPAMPASRAKLVNPFVSLNCPSPSSEFALPEIIISLTILSYAREGLRYTDFVTIIDHLRNAMMKELGVYSKRPSNIRYNEWVTGAGGAISGTSSAQVVQLDEDGEPIEAEEIPEVVSLRLLKRSNHQQMDVLYNLLVRHPPVIQWYLDTIIFPDCMRHQALKFSASGVDLGSDLLFNTRIGFSGTPSDLLPLDLGKCAYEKGSDGQVLSVLTSPQFVSTFHVDQNWSVDALLSHIATARVTSTSASGELVEELAYHALIDVGALITGMDNIDVAKYLLTHGLSDHVDGVVYLDESDKKMFLAKASMKSVPLEQCGAKPERYFTFYDQVHTTGIDVKHRLNGCAVVTIGKDVTMRDFSQGCFRMRGIGQGQSIHVLITPEMQSLMDRQLSCLEVKDANGHTPLLIPLDNLVKQTEVTNPAVIKKMSELARLAGFLVLNQMLAERTQFCQLSVQNVTNVWKKRVFAKLLGNSQYFNFQRFPDTQEAIQLRTRLQQQEQNVRKEKFLATIDDLKSTDKRQYRAAIRKFDAIEKKNKQHELKKLDQLLLEDYLEQCINVYQLAIRTQLVNIKANRDPKMMLGTVMGQLKRFLTKQRRDFESKQLEHITNPEDELERKKQLLKSSKLFKLGAFKVQLTPSTKDENGERLATVDDVANTDDGGKKDVVSQFATMADLAADDEESGQTGIQRDFDFEALMTVFHEDVDHSILDSVPKFTSFYDTLHQTVNANAQHLVTPAERAACAHVLSLLRTTANDHETYSLSAEMVQTLEDERVREQEQEQEQQVEIEKFVDCAYDRSFDKQIPWMFDLLGNAFKANPDGNQVIDIEGNLPQFYHANKFAVIPLSNNSAPKASDAGSEVSVADYRLSAQFPDVVYFTQNYYNNTFVNGARRLKNINMYLDWIPSTSQLTPAVNNRWTSAQGRALTDVETQQLVHDLDVVIKTTLLIGLCKQCMTISTHKYGSDEFDQEQQVNIKLTLDQLDKFKSLAELLTAPLDALQINQQHAQDLIFILTMKQQITEQLTIQSSESNTPLVDFLNANKKVDISTVIALCPDLITKSTFDLSPFFKDAQHINAKQFIVDFITSQSFAPTESHRYAVVVSLAEAETLRRIVHVKEQLALFAHLDQLDAALRQDTSQKTRKKRSKDFCPEMLMVQPVVANKDTTFSLRSLSYQGMSLATTANHVQPTPDHHFNSLQLLRFLNNEVNYTDVELHSLINMLDGNMSPALFAPIASPHYITSKSLPRFFISVLSARRRLQSRYPDSPIRLVLNSPNRYHLYKITAVSALLKYFITLQSQSFSAVDVYEWTDLNSDGKIVPSEFYATMQYIVTNLWAYFVQPLQTALSKNASSPVFAQSGATEAIKQLTKLLIGTALEQPSSPIINQDISNIFPISHHDIVQLFSTALPLNVVHSTQASSSQPIVSLSGNDSMALTFKEFCHIVKVNEDEELDDTNKETTPAKPTQTVESPTTPTTALASPTASLLVNNFSTTLPLAPDVVALDHDVFTNILALNNGSDVASTRPASETSTLPVDSDTEAQGLPEQDLSFEGGEGDAGEGDAFGLDELDPQILLDTQQGLDTGEVSDGSDEEDQDEDDEDDDDGVRRGKGKDKKKTVSPAVIARVHKEVRQIAKYAPTHINLAAKCIELSFTTPHLPEFVKILGEGKFVQAESGLPEDNYWELEPYSGLIIDPTQFFNSAILAKSVNGLPEDDGEDVDSTVQPPIYVTQAKGNKTTTAHLERFKKQTAVTFEVSTPTLEKTEGIHPFYRTPARSNPLADLYQRLESARAAIKKEIYHHQVSKTAKSADSNSDASDSESEDAADSTYWVNPVDINRLVSDATVEQFIQQSEDPTVSASWPIAVKRSVRFYTQTLNQIEVTREETEASAFAVGPTAVAKHPRLTDGCTDQKPTIQMIVGGYVPDQFHVLGQPTNTFLNNFQGCQFNQNFSEQIPASTFSSDAFTAVSIFAKDSDSSQQSRRGRQPNINVCIGNKQGLQHTETSPPQWNNNPVILFGSSDFAICRQPCRIRKAIFWFDKDTTTTIQPLQYLRTIASLEGGADALNKQDDDAEPRFGGMPSGFGFDGEGDMPPGFGFGGFGMPPGFDGEGDMPPGFGFGAPGGFGFGAPGGFGDDMYDDDGEPMEGFDEGY